MQTKIANTTLSLVTGDIAEQDTDAVVTAAHWRLNKGNGTDGTIHSKGGPRIYEECRKIGGCPIGDAVITTGGDLKARHVIHAVGPVWRGGDEQEPELLASAYRRSLEVAVQNGLRSISFPSISTGAFVYPIRLAAPIALRTIIQFLEQERHNLEEVRLVLYTREDAMAYTVFVQALERLLAERIKEGASPRDDIASIYVHDGRLLRVIEDTERDTLTMEVELPTSPDSDDLSPHLLIFEDIHGYQVFDGPFKGVPAILNMKVIGEDGRWQRIRIETNAGNRELFCTAVRVTDPDGT